MSDDECPVDDTVSWPIIRCEREALRARITELEAEVKTLTRWKAEAIGVLADWEAVWEAAGRLGPLGTSKADAVRRALEEDDR